MYTVVKLEYHRNFIKVSRYHKWIILFRTCKRQSLSVFLLDFILFQRWEEKRFHWACAVFSWDFSTYPWNTNYKTKCKQQVWIQERQGGTFKDTVAAAEYTTKQNKRKMLVYENIQRDLSSLVRPFSNITKAKKKTLTLYLYNVSVRMNVPTTCSVAPCLRHNKMF